MGKVVRILALAVMAVVFSGCCYVSYDQYQDTMRYKPECECDYFFIDLGPAAQPNSPVDEK